MVAVISIGAGGGARGSEPAAHNALPERRAQASSPAPGASRTRPSLANRVHSAGAAARPRLQKGAFPP